MFSAKEFRKWEALLIYLLLLILVFAALLPFFKGILGALVLFVLFLPLYLRLERRMRRGLAAMLVIILTLLIVLLPLVLIGALLTQEAMELLRNREAFEQLGGQIPRDVLPPEVMEQLVVLGNELLSELRSWASDAVEGVASFAINITLMYFILFFMFVEHRKFKQATMVWLPFSEANSKKLIDEFKRVTYSTIVGNGVVAVVQGLLLGAAFFALGIQGVLLWTMVTIILSLLPLVGAFLVWIPASIIQFVLGHPVRALILAIWGVFISYIDNFIRPYVQRRVGNLHPLLSIGGIIIGIPLFGLIGIIFGPLLLAYVVVMGRMFKEEYLQ